MSYGNRPQQGLGGISGVLNNVQLVWRLMQDNRVSTALKVIVPLIVGLYFISPIDVIPDFIPALGQLDDIGVILLGMTMFINMAPKGVVAEHRQAMGLESGSADTTSRGNGTAGGANTRPMGANATRDRVVETTYRDGDGLAE